ncbi:hypothetical protein N7468_002602 [Penicillium chermesinum]|uniref:DNA repair protein REV1 n=1 Tax=Penicillium chermesinum TaxID=63820 RepID=A0A9W9PJ14_9EURO|nr:uncharacterized protein N7468_002602 [Penicillium chermesinum]KAJ5247619.1 hypothetical protein N7468_002602 [Penicillium chermesinum]
MSSHDQTPNQTAPAGRDPPNSPHNHSQSDYGEFPSFVYAEDEQMDAKDAASEEVLTEPPNPDAGATLDGNTEVHDMLPPPKPPVPPNPQLTSEEYNAQLLSDPRMRQSSVVNPEFLQQYYRESRLHHLSTWKAELKAQLQAAAKEKAQTQGARKNPVAGARRYILHVDFDSFFAAVSLLKHPELRDKPIAIAHGSGSGSEIASCNYIARAHGVKNGMWMKGAQQACPELKVLPYDFPAYEDASRKFYKAILSIDGIVQSVSIDEALVDVTSQCIEAGGSDGKAISEGSIYREQARADEIAQRLRDEVKEKTGCAVSVGIGANVLQAKVALRKAKPAGQFQLKPDEVLEFIGNLDVRDLPGVGYSMTAKLEELGVKLVKDLREFTRERLSSSLGPKTGVRLWEYSRGMDKTEVGNEVVRKSISAEVNWGIRFTNQEQSEDFVKSLCEELNRRLVDNLVKGKHLTLKVMRRSMDAPLEPVKHLGHGKCDTFNKSAVLGVATNSPDILAKEAISMLRTFNFSPGDLRGLGVQMTKLEPIKTGPSANLDSSQKLLSFSKSPSRKSIIKPETRLRNDKVAEPTTPPPGTSAAQSMDTAGSQFIMPTQADPSILSELPIDIRSRLVAQAKPHRDSRSGSPSPCPPQAQNKAPATATLPPQSQLDPEILAALPDDVRNEIMGYYNPDPSPRMPDSMPQLGSPGPAPAPAATTSRPMSAGALGTKRPYSPSKKRRGRPPKVARVDNSTNMTLAGFVSRPVTAAPLASRVEEAHRQVSPAVEEQTEVSAEFLAALPDDIRQEILDEQRRAQTKQDAVPAPRPATPRETPPVDPEDDTSADQMEKRLPLPPLPARPVFTSQRLWQLPDLRNAVEEWHSAFAAEGPYTEDLEVLCAYIGRVVVDEKDIDKAVSLVRWVARLVEDSPFDQSQQSQAPHSAQGTVTWEEAMATLYTCVQTALEARGLPPVDFD